MTFDPADASTWPEELRGISPDELRKFADALTCAVMALEEGAVDSRIEFQGDRRVALFVAKALEAMQSEADPTGQ